MKRKHKVIYGTLGVCVMVAVGVTVSMVDCTEKSDYIDPIDRPQTPVMSAPPDDILTAIADPALKTYCTSQMGQWDTDQDGELSPTEAAAVLTISVPSKGIATLEGIEFFTGLSVLNCYNNPLAEIDLTHNTALTSLNCGFNRLLTLDVSKAPGLKILQCQRNLLTSLDVSAATGLTNLNCANNKITSLDVSAHTALVSLDCSYNQIETLGTTTLIALTDLDCSENNLVTLDLSTLNNLSYCNCYNNSITSLNLSECTILASLSCQSNSLAGLDISNNRELRTLICYANPGTEDTFAIKAWFDGGSAPNSFPEGTWQYNGQTIEVAYRQM